MLIDLTYICYKYLHHNPYKCGWMGITLFVNEYSVSDSSKFLEGLIVSGWLIERFKWPKHWGDKHIKYHLKNIYIVNVESTIFLMNKIKQYSSKLLHSWLNIYGIRTTPSLFNEVLRLAEKQKIEMSLNKIKLISQLR